MPNPISRERLVYLRPIVWVVYGALFAIAVPWYWPEDTTNRWFGIPIWAVVSIGTSAIISIFTAWLLLNCWPKDDEMDALDS